MSRTGIVRSVSRTRRFLGGLGFGLLYQALVMMVGLWLTPFLLGRVGQHGYGLWLVATQIMGYLMLLDLGVVALLPRETAYATGRAGGSALAARDLPELVGHTFKLVLCQTPLVALAAFVAWRFFIPADWGELRVPLGAAFLAFVLMFPLRIFSSLLQGLQDLAFIGAVQVTTWVASNALTVAMIFGGFGLRALAAGWIASQALMFIACGVRLWRRFPEAFPRRLPPLSWAKTRQWLAGGVWVSVAQVAQVLLNGTDLLVVGKLLGPAAVVPYSCTSKLIAVLSNQPTLIMSSAAPALSELKADANRARIRDVASSLAQATLLASGAIAVVVLAVNPGFVAWWVGAQQFGGMTLSALLVANMLLRHWNVTAVYAIFCFGYERRISLVVLLDGLVTAGATALAVWLFGVVAAPLGSILGVLAVSLPGNLSALARETDSTLPKLVASLWPWLWRLVLVAGVAVGISLAWRPSGFFALAATGAVVGLLYVGALLPVALRPPLVHYLRPRLAPLLARVSGGRWQLAPK